MWTFPRRLRATQITLDISLGSWPMVVDPVDEPDGGTFYRPEPPTWLSGSGEPDPILGDEGDYYMDTDAAPPEWYGPKGVEDSAGDGDWGETTPLPDAGDGSWITGAGDPDDLADGDDGDYYLDTTDMAWWGPKADGTWADTGPNHVKAAWIEFDTPRPRSSGLFSIPANTLAVGDENETGELSADAWLELGDVNGRRILLVPAAQLSAEDGPAVRIDAVELLVHLQGNEELFKARWKIVGDKGLKWSGSGNLVQYA